MADKSGVQYDQVSSLLAWRFLRKERAKLWKPCFNSLHKKRGYFLVPTTGEPRVGLGIKRGPQGSVSGLTDQQLCLSSGWGGKMGAVYVGSSKAWVKGLSGS